MRMFFKGDRVCQRQYGTGTILDANERHTIIDFDDHGLRTFSTPLVELQHTAVPAPPPRRVSRPKRVRAGGDRIPKGK